MGSPKPEKEYRSTRCIYCKESFTYVYSTRYPKDAELIVKMTCPFCHKPLTVDLSPYKRPKIESYKSGAFPNNRFT